MASETRVMANWAVGEASPAVTLDPRYCSAQATWKERRRFQAAAQALVRLPAPGAQPEEVLWGEAVWRRWVPPGDQEEMLATALSQATGVYFFPSREWVRNFCRFAGLMRSRRVLEAGAGRGYLAAFLEPVLTRLGVAFKAVDMALGEFESGLPRHPVVEAGDALAAVQSFRPDLVIYAWPPPGQSIGPLLREPGVRYVLVLGEAGGGCTGDPEDWRRYGGRVLRALSRFGLGRSGRRCQAATLFRGGTGRPTKALLHIKDEVL